MGIFRKEKTLTRTRYYLFGVRLCSLHVNNKLDLDEIYDEEFYKQQAEDSIKSAREIIPFVHSILEPKSVLDIGCGAGTWLNVWKEQGASIQGADGNTIPESGLYVPRSNIVVSDLVADNLQDKLDKADLVESLEVAEHIYEDKADKFIDLLCSKSDAVLFSAAIPYQGGTHHVNLQPLDYWNQKFRSRGFVCFDILRDKFWNNNNICFWYRQNILLFARGGGRTKIIIPRI